MNKSVAMLVLALSLPGCAHLDQAPLVYTSRTALGIDVSGGAADTPGLAMTVGYKQVDAAYVPVAVARSCRNASSSACTGDAFDLRVIGGSSLDANGTDGRDATESAAVAEVSASAELFQQAVDAAAQARQRQHAEAQAVEALRAKIDPLTARQRQFEQGRDELADLKASADRIHQTPTPGDEAQLAEINARIHVIEAQALDADEKSTLANLEVQFKSANDDLVNANADLGAKEAAVERRRGELAQKREAISQFNKNDSFSVFGSFEGKTKGSTSEASVGIGKIFATGVASQNISGGLANMYRTRNDVLTACYQAVAKGTVTDADALKKLLEGCRAQ